MIPSSGPASIDRMFLAVEKVRERLSRATRALEQASVPYAVVGGHAVAAWVARSDEVAARNTPDVDLLIRRDDYSAVAVALASVGFVAGQHSGFDIFLDGHEGKARDAVYLFYAGERVRPDDPEPSPDLDESGTSGAFRVLDLSPLVRMKLTLHRTKDRVHMRDMIDVGLVDDTWLEHLPNGLAARLKELLDDPEG